MSMLNDNMLAFGSCIAGAGILITGLLALLFRHPGAPRWTRPEAVALLLCVPVTGAIGFGLGYTTYGLYEIAGGTGDPLELLAPAAVVIVLALVWRGLRIRHRLKDYALAAAAPTAGAGEAGIVATTDPPASLA